MSNYEIKLLKQNINTRILKILVLGVTLCNFTVSAETSFFDDHARGWHWYEDPDLIDEEKQEKDTEAKMKYPATEALKIYQAELDEAKALAVMSPTPENILNYQRIQYDAIDRAGKFSKEWMKNVYLHPEIDHSLKNPTFQLARHIYYDEQQANTEKKIKELSREYGLFFFFKSDCPYCKGFAPIVKAFSRKYNWEVLAISEYGETHELFDRTVQDNGLAETWGVKSYPALFAVNPNSGHVIPIANGMISINQMEERILAITGDDND